MRIDSGGFTSFERAVLEANRVGNRGTKNRTKSKGRVREVARESRHPRGAPRFAAFGIVFLFMASAWMSIIPRADAAAMLVVDDDGVECPTADFTTIQAAVTAAAGMPGMQTIRVCPGTYVENVMIGAGNSLEIRGDGATKVFVKAPAGTPGPIINAESAGTVEVRGLTVDGASAMMWDSGDGSQRVWGIRFLNTDGEIRENNVLHVRDASGAAQGAGIRVDVTSGMHNVNVENNRVEDWTRAGIIANGVGADIRVKHNDVVGPTLPKVWAPNGIQISRGATGRVEHNKVRDATWAGAGSGILLFCAGPSTVQNNKVDGSDVGIALADTAGAKVINNKVTNSVYDAYSLQFLGKYYGVLLGCPNDPDPSPVHHNVLQENRASDSAWYGVSVYNFDPTFDGAYPTGFDALYSNDIKNNDLKGSGVDGIAVLDDIYRYTYDFSRQPGATGNKIRDNTIKDSVRVDANDQTFGSGTAGTANEWKHNKCDTSFEFGPGSLCSSKVIDGVWTRFGTARLAKDPTDPMNKVLSLDTTDYDSSSSDTDPVPGWWNPYDLTLEYGGIARDLNVQVSELTGHLSVDYYLVGHDCGGGSPRLVFAADLDGDGAVDGYFVGYVGPAPNFVGCAEDSWQFQDLTDGAGRWDLTYGLPAGPYGISWAGVAAYFASYPDHRILGGWLVDDSSWMAGAAGLTYYDNVQIGDRTFTG